MSVCGHSINKKKVYLCASCYQRGHSSKSCGKASLPQSFTQGTFSTPKVYVQKSSQQGFVASNAYGTREVQSCSVMHMEHEMVSSDNHSLIKMEEYKMSSHETEKDEGMVPEVAAFDKVVREIKMLVSQTHTDITLAPSKGEFGHETNSTRTKFERHRALDNAKTRTIIKPKIR